MTKKLEELFDLDQMKQSESENHEENTEQPEKSAEEIKQAIADVDKIDEALPMVKNLELNDTEMDDIAKKATDTFDDLMSLGYNVEARYASEIFGTAARLLDTALAAKGGKIDRKIKMLQLQIQKARLDQMQAKQDKETGIHTVDGEIKSIDRNDLLNLFTKDSKKPGVANTKDKSDTIVVKDDKDKSAENDK